MPLSYGAFIYPDLRTAIIGRFSSSSSRLLLVAGKATEIKRVTDFGALKRVTFGDPDFAESSPAYKYDPPNHYRYRVRQ